MWGYKIGSVVWVRELRSGVIRKLRVPPITQRFVGHCSRAEAG